MAKVHLNSAKSLVTNPYLNGKVCQSMISIMIKIHAVTTNCIGFINA